MKIGEVWEGVEVGRGGEKRIQFDIHLNSNSETVWLLNFSAFYETRKTKVGRGFQNMSYSIFNGILL